MAKHINEELLGQNQEGPARFLPMLARTGGNYGFHNIDMQLWTVDGTAGPAYTADVGTDGQQQHPVLLFDYQTADDKGFVRFAVPPDYDGGKIYLLIWWYVNDNTAAHNAVWAGTVQRVPSGMSYAASSSYAGNVVLDVAGVAFTSVSNAFVSDAVNEIQVSVIDLTTSTDGALLEPLDLALVQLFNDVSEDDLGAGAYVCHSAIMYTRGSVG
jgi:hypothetical protein